MSSTLLIKQIDTIKQEFFALLADATTQEALEACRLQFLSRNGTIASLMPLLKNLSLEDKKTIGPLINELKEITQNAFFERKSFLQKIALQNTLEQSKDFDVTAYVPQQPRGSLHPLTHMLHKIEDIFISMGYKVMTGPEVETEYYNFEALNIPADHPARDMWDTFWIDIPGLLLRTHTSTVQIRAMKTQSLPLAIVAPGRAYRHEATDATHDFMFNQIEGLLIDKHISFAHLLGTLKVFFRALFLQSTLEIRVRPSYFPFVEPGVEVDISCPFCTSGCSPCKKSGWIEIGGAGLTHPHVLKSCNIDPQEYSGFAFGLGLDRITMLMYGIKDIRLFSNNNIKFLEQF
jgi:phenylalanyl-tRNA synthetase alpha chain